MSATSAIELTEHLREMEECLEEMESKSDQELLDLLRDGFRLLRTHLVRLANTLAVAESRGLKVHLSKNHLKLLQQIHSGKLLAEVVGRLASRPVTMAHVSSLSPEKQAEMLELSDDEIDQKAREARHTRVSEQEKLPSATRNGTHSTASARATAEEAVKRCLEIVLSCADPQEAAEGLIHRMAGVLAKRSA